MHLTVLWMSFSLLKVVQVPGRRGISMITGGGLHVSTDERITLGRRRERPTEFCGRPYAVDVTNDYSTLRWTGKLNVLITVVQMVTCRADLWRYGFISICCGYANSHCTWTTAR